MVNTDHGPERENGSGDHETSCTDSEDDHTTKPDGWSTDRRGMLKGLGAAAAAAIVPATSAQARQNSAPPVRVHLATPDGPAAPEAVLQERKKTIEDFEDVGNDPGQRSFETGLEMGNESVGDGDLAAYVRTTDPDGTPLSAIITTQDGSFADAHRDALRRARGLTEDFGTELRISTPVGRDAYDATDLTFEPADREAGAKLGGNPVTKKPDGVDGRTLNFTATGYGGNTEMIYWVGAEYNSDYIGTSRYVDYDIYQISKVINVPKNGYTQYDPEHGREEEFTLGHQIEKADVGDWTTYDYAPDSDPGQVANKDVDLTVDGGGADAEFTYLMPQGTYKDKSDPTAQIFAGALLYNWDYDGDQTIAYTNGSAIQSPTETDDNPLRSITQDDEDVRIAIVKATGWFQNYSWWYRRQDYSQFKKDIYLDYHAENA